MTPVPRITCEICPGLLPPFFHPRIKLRARIAHGGGRRPGNEATYVPVVVFAVQPERGSGACLLYTYLLRAENVYVRARLLAPIIN